MVNKNVLLMSLGAITIGFSPIVVKGVNLSPSLIAFYRFFFGSLAMGVFIIISKTKIDKSSFYKALPYIIASGFFFSFDLWNWHRSIKIVGAGVATLLANTQVFYLVVISWIILKERPRWFFYPSMLMAFIGLGVVTTPYINFNILDNNSLGVIYGLITGLTYALVTFFMKRSTEIYNGPAIFPIFFITTASTIFSLIFSILEGNIVFPQGEALFLMICYGAVIHFLGWILITNAITKIPLALASLLLLLQPVFSTILGNMIYKESLSNIQITGLAVTLVSIFFATLARSTNSK